MSSLVLSVVLLNEYGTHVWVFVVVIGVAGVITGSGSEGSDMNRSLDRLAKERLMSEPFLRQVV